MEIGAATKHLGVQFHALGFPDGELAFVEQRVLVDAVLHLVRTYAYAAIFSLHPSELTPQIHHSDHSVAARVTEVVATLADVNGYTPNGRVDAALWNESVSRPDYWVWYSGWLMLQAKHLQPDEVMIFEQNWQDRQKQLEYLLMHHASQAGPGSEQEWRTVLDRVSFNRQTGKHEEHYLRVR